MSDGSRLATEKTETTFKPSQKADFHNINKHFYT